MTKHDAVVRGDLYLQDVLMLRSQLQNSHNESDYLRAENERLREALATYAATIATLKANAECNGIDRSHIATLRVDNERLRRELLSMIETAEWHAPSDPGFETASRIGRARAALAGKGGAE